MNFDFMPELHWTFGYPIALGEMVFLGVALYVVFKKKMAVTRARGRQHFELRSLP